MNERDLDVAVIGGGAAGLAAAITARETGAESVLVIDRNEELGGVLPQCIHTGFGLHYFRENLTGPEYVTRFIQKVESLDIDILLNTMVVEVTPKKQVIAVNSDIGVTILNAKSVILSMGCRERPRGSLKMPGTRPAGIFTAGTSQRILDIEGYLPGKKVLILGSGDVGLIMARRFAMEGAEVVAVVERLPYPGGLSRNVVQCLEDFNIPLLLEHTVTFIHGRDRVTGVRVSQVDKENNPIIGSEREIECDTLILSVGLIPENELSIDMGVALDPSTGGPLVDEHMQTSIPGVFACGNVVHVHDLVDHVTEAGELAGRSAARYAMGQLTPSKHRTSLKIGENVRYVVPQYLSCDKPVDLYLRVRKPMQNAEIVLGNLTERRRAVRPPETVVFRLTEAKLKRLDRKNELTISVVEGRKDD